MDSEAFAGEKIDGVHSFGEVKVKQEMAPRRREQPTLRWLGPARRLHDTLQGRGVRCWLDEHILLPGDKIYTEVDRGIRLWDKVLLCCSKDSLTSWWVDNEIKIAFDKEQRLWRERGKEVLALIPLNLDDYLFSGKWQSGLATEVKARMAADFGGWERDNQKFDAQFGRLLKALRTESGGREPPPPVLL